MRREERGAAPPACLSVGETLRCCVPAFSPSQMIALIISFKRPHFPVTVSPHVMTATVRVALKGFSCDRRGLQAARFGSASLYFFGGCYKSASVSVFFIYLDFFPDTWLCY